MWSIEAGVMGRSGIAFGYALRVAFALLILATSVWALPAMAAPLGAVLIVAPHPDDDLLIGAGVAASALSAGRPVKVVFMTNGGYGGTKFGLTRQQKAMVAQTTFIGTAEQDCIFLGYPDGALSKLRKSYRKPSDVYTNEHGQSKTYGRWGLGGRDYHTYRFGSAAPYNEASVLQDLESILETVRPSDIYTVSEFDRHPDHATTYQWVKSALAKRMAADQTYRATLHKTIVWSRDPDHWPGAADPGADHVEIPQLSETNLVWSARESIRVPAAMQSRDFDKNPKYRAIQVHRFWRFLNSFVRRDEIFWIDKVSANLASVAAVTASSELSLAGHQAVNAVDGVTDSEWIAKDGKTGNWLKLTWPRPITVNRVVLYDRPNGHDQIAAARLLFSDGAEMPTGSLHNFGAPVEINFADKTTSSIQLIIDKVSSSTRNIGLAEIEVERFEPSANRPPQTRAGPNMVVRLGAVARLNGTQSSDADGDPLTYHWTQTAGPAVQLSNPTAAAPVFTSPDVPATLTFSLVASDPETAGAPENVTVRVSGPNLAPKAAVTASSEAAWAQQGAVKAVDGVARGYPMAPSREWVADRGGAGNWIKLTWPAPVTVNRVVLYDRPNRNDQITAARLLFSDGTQLATGSLHNYGAPVEMNFAEKKITSITLFVDATSPSTRDIGLAEIEVYGRQ